MATGHSTAPGNRANCLSNCIFPQLICLKNENVKVKVKYGFVLYTGLSFALMLK
jgi:hypothetical protein